MQSIYQSLGADEVNEAIYQGGSIRASDRRGPSLFLSCRQRVNNPSAKASGPIESEDDPVRCGLPVIRLPQNSGIWKVLCPHCR